MWIIGANIEWNRLPLSSTDVGHKPQHSSTKIMGTIKLEIRLLKSHAKSLSGRFEEFLNSMYFYEEAFQPRPLLITIERGLFAMDNEGMNVALMLERPHKMRAGRCGLRLCFDQSPYPSIESTKKEGPFGGNTGYLDLSKYTYAVGKEFLASAKYTATRNGSHASETRCAIS
jgi:hypothetical protein